MSGIDVYPRGATQGATLGYAQVTANQTGIGATETDLTGLTVTVTVPANRRIRITGKAIFNSASVGGIAFLFLKEGATQHNEDIATLTNGDYWGGHVEVVLTPTEGTHTYKLTARQSAGTLTLEAAAAHPAYILVEDITGSVWPEGSTPSLPETYYSYSNTPLAGFTPPAAISASSFTVPGSGLQRLFHVQASVSHHGNNALGTVRAWSIRLDSTRVIPKWNRTVGGNINNDDGVLARLNDTIPTNGEGFNADFSGIVVVPGDGSPHTIDLYCQAVDDVTTTVITQFSVVATRVA